MNLNKIILLVILTMIIFSCGDNSNTETKCNPECDSNYQECIDSVCKLKEGSCDTLSDCLRGFECNNHICEQKKCNPECDSYQECLDGVCETKTGFCSQNSDCVEENYICDNGTHLCKEKPCDIVDECNGVYTRCGGYNKLEICEASECGFKLKEEICPENEGCFKGGCVPTYCSDECNPGEIKDGKVCEMWNIGTSNWQQTDQDSYLYDRAQEHLRWLYNKLMFFGGVVETYFTDNSLEVVNSHGGVGDSAIWTGTYLGSESFRYLATGSKISYENIKNLVKLLHIWFNVSGSPGLLVRFAAETEKLEAVEYNTEDMTNCSNNRIYCDIEYNGKIYNYKGHISRDQYQGILLGYSLAYSTLGSEDEDIKSLIRDDIVELIKELMKERELHIRYEIYDDRIVGNPLDPNSEDGVLKGSATIKTRFAVESPREFEDGKVVVKYCSVETPDCETNFRGFQEFMPDLKPFLKQIDGIGWLISPLPYIPRPGSAIMLSTIFNIGIQVTDGVEGYETINQEIKDFYYNNNDKWKNVNDWLTQAEDWEYSGKCGEKYYGINIVMEPLFNLMRLEQNPAIKERIINNVLVDKLWGEVHNHKNSFFSYIYLTQKYDEDIKNIANEQFRGFKGTPKRHFAVDLRSNPKYLPMESGCENQVNHDNAVDVSDREMSDFIWQRKPWALYSGANPRRVYPGVDYLIVYWMGLYYGFLDDESNGKCFRWRDISK